MTVVDPEETLAEIRAQFLTLPAEYRSRTIAALFDAAMNATNEKRTRDMTPEEVAYELQLSRDTVYERLRTGRIASRREGDLYRVRPEALDEYRRNEERGVTGSRARGPRHLN